MNDNLDNFLKNYNRVISLSYELINIIKTSQGNINIIINKSKELDKMFNQFLLHSRHKNFSMILILHNLRHAMQKRTSFERSFLDQLDIITIFEPNTYKNHIYSFLKNLLDSEVSQNLDNIFEKASSLLQYPYILITCKQKILNDNFSKIRIDVLDKNLILRSNRLLY